MSHSLAWVLALGVLLACFVLILLLLRRHHQPITTIALLCLVGVLALIYVVRGG